MARLRNLFARRADPPEFEPSAGTAEGRDDAVLSDDDIRDLDSQPRPAGSEPRPSQLMVIDTVPGGRGDDVEDARVVEPRAAEQTRLPVVVKIEPPADEPPPKPREPDRVPIEAADRAEYAQTMFLDTADRSIGEILRQEHQLTAEQVEAVLEHQNRHGTRFGESAVTLGYVKGPDVVRALSRQFGYDYAPLAGRQPIGLTDDLVIANHPFSEVSEVIRDLRSQLLAGVLGPEAVPPRALALVSLSAGDGKSWFAANLAVSLSQLGARTLLVDANLRTPRQHAIFGLPEPKTGLSGILNRGHKADVLRPVRELPYLYLLPAGPVPPNPLEIVQGRGFADLLARLRTKFTHVIVDTPALDAGADARVLAARCGASVLIGRRHRSPLERLAEAARHLSKGDAQFAGLVLNDV